MHNNKTKYTKNHRWLMILSSILLLVALSACDGNAAENTKEDTIDIFEDFIPMVSATGKVVPKEWTTLSVSAPGIIFELPVGENDEVSAGHVLVVLSGSENLKAAISAAELELTSAQQALDALNENADLGTTEAVQSIANARDAVRDAERKVTNLKTASASADIDQAYANVILMADKLETAREDFEPYQNKVDTNINRAAHLSIMAQAENNYDDAVRLWNNLRGGANEIDLAQAEADLNFAQAWLENAEIEYAKVQNGPDPDDLAVAVARVQNAQNQLAAAQTALADLSLTAPFDGTISHVYVRQNEWVNPGQPVIDIGNLEHMEVETTDLNEIDVARIQVGSIATVSFDALPESVVTATVIRIATKSSPGTGVNYSVILELDEIPEGLLWDMTAFIDIEVE